MKVCKHVTRRTAFSVNFSKQKFWGGLLKIKVILNCSNDSLLYYLLVLATSMKNKPDFWSS